MGNTKKYWKGVEELANTPAFVHAQQNEFVEPVPVEDFIAGRAPDETGTSRRDFLKYLGFSLTAASIAACETPVTKAIPYVIKPEEVVPGVANWYATTYFDGHDYSHILVKTREGRPIKIEGNPLSTLTQGAVNARVQASVLSLYDTERITGPYAKGTPSTWVKVDKEINEKLTAIQAKGGAIRILSSTVASPSTHAVITEFTQKYPNTKHISYDAVSYYGMLKANASSFGVAAMPVYHFDKAQAIVSVGADFLGTWLAPAQFAKQYAKNRKVSRNKKEMSKHIQFESTLSLTGSNADVRLPVKPSQLAAVVLNLYNAIAELLGTTKLPASVTPYDSQIKAAAQLLWENKKRSLLVCGLNDAYVQTLVNTINSMLDNYENTLQVTDPSYLKQGNDEQLVALISELKEGKVDALITYNCNPVYNLPTVLGFTEAYQRVGLKIALSGCMDETASQADYVCPDHHYLESWNDTQATSTYFSLVQPTIAPLFSKPKHEGTRAAQETLLTWAGNATDYYTYVKKYWESHLFPKQSKEAYFAAFWNQSLHDGVVQLAVNQSTTNPISGANKKHSPAENQTKEPQVTSVATALTITDAVEYINNIKGAEWELVAYEKIGIGDGTQANNPWLQELPDPVSKVTWDNYLTMNPADMKAKGLMMMERQDRWASVVKVSVNGSTLTLPVYPQPGQAKGTLAVALGYGRTHAGKVATNLGTNVFAALTLHNGSVQTHIGEVSIENTSETYEFAATQIHHTMMGRRIVQETTLNEYVRDSHAGNEPILITTHEGKKSPNEVNLWADHERLGHRWGMAIDLNSCIGCGACVVSCTAENNVPVVGKDQIKRTRDMAWIRIDRYYSSDMTEEKAKADHVSYKDMNLEMENPSFENPQVVFQPVMCQHCNHAPCETVCPVLATNHSNEGLNQMTYNRCVGTRYCANNCPYKVRRFNWYNYVDNYRFTDVNPAANELGRMVLNPDVVVRSRGVMEKCSMCVQRIQEGKLNAKKQMRTIKDGEIQTACSQSCPTNAIVFGDLNDPESAVNTLVKDERNYYMLEELGVQPSVSYLVKVRNTEPQEA